MLRIKKMTDYAVLILANLALHDSYVTAKENFSELIQKNLNSFDYIKYFNKANSYLKKFHDNKIIAKKILNSCIDI